MSEPAPPAPLAPLERDTPRDVWARFWLVHLGLPLLPLSAPTPRLVALMCAVYALQMFGIEGGYHRYFSHRSFKTSRPARLILALLATSSGQRGPLTWAANHRRHHKLSDRPGDPHSPIVHSWWHAHAGWIWGDESCNPSAEWVRDWLKSPELLLLNRYHYLVPYALFFFMFWLGERGDLLGPTTGLDGVVWGVVVPTLLSLHLTLLVNSLAHGRRGAAPFASGDHSRNIWWLGVLNFGPGWHNNHHAYESAARAGLWWWQVDVSYWILWVLARLGVVWDLRDFPARMRERG